MALDLEFPLNDLATPVRQFLAPLRPSALEFLVAFACGTSLACSDDDYTVRGETDLPDADTSDDTDAGTQPSPPDAGNAAALDGVWLERGYARLMHVSDRGAVEYHVTGVSCTAAGEYSLDDVLEHHDRIDVGSDTLSWYERDHFTRHEFDRLESLPVTCAEPGALDAQHVYDAFWRLFDQNYAFFDLRGVDWDATAEAHAGELNDSSSDEDLMTALSLSIDSCAAGDGGESRKTSKAGREGSLFSASVAVNHRSRCVILFSPPWWQVC